MSVQLRGEKKDVPSDFASPVEKTGDLLELDDAVLQAQGHKSELERSFSWVGAIGLAYRYECCIPGDKVLLF